MIKQFITFTLLFLSLMVSSTAYAQTTQSNSTDAEPKKVPPVKELSDGIFAFICDEINNTKNVPLIFIDEGEVWALTGMSWFAVTKIKDGFILKSSGENESFGILKEDDDKVWNLNFLSEDGPFNSICQSQEGFVDILVKAISHKIINNGNTLARDQLENADTELSAMTLSLEAQRKKAEETLTLLAAANSARKSIEIDYNKSLSEAELQAVLVSQANELLNKEKTLSANSQRKLALLNAQTEELRNQLNQLQSLLDRSNDADAKSKIQLKMLGTNLNAALARVAAEQRKVAIEQTKVATEQKKLAAEQKKLADLEIKERERLAAEAIDLKKFRSEFFGRLREVMEAQEGVRIVGDRFVFSSEVLFQIGSADLGLRGKREIRKVAVIINQIADEIPSGIDWILRVDGHTDSIPITNGINFSDNWELSQARALSVVRYLINDLNIPANRLAANGFGEFQPIDDRKTPEAYKTNRRIELKFTER